MRRIGHWVALGCVIGFLNVSANSAFADDPSAPTASLSADVTERIEDGDGDLRRVQKRRTDSAIPSGRRSLSADERRALHRELRDAMKGAYADERSTRRKP